MKIFLVQLYLISLSCIVEEYWMSRVTPWAPRLSCSSVRALPCWPLFACRTEPMVVTRQHKVSRGGCWGLLQNNLLHPEWWGDGSSSPCRMLSAASHRNAGSYTAKVKGAGLIDMFVPYYVEIYIQRLAVNVLALVHPFEEIKLDNIGSKLKCRGMQNNQLNCSSLKVYFKGPVCRI